MRGYIRRGTNSLKSLVLHMLQVQYHVSSRSLSQARMKKTKQKVSIESEYTWNI
jgi:hypothetical protein